MTMRPLGLLTLALGVCAAAIAAGIAVASSNRISAKGGYTVIGATLEHEGRGILIDVVLSEGADEMFEVRIYAGTPDWLPGAPGLILIYDFGDFGGDWVL